MNIRVHRWVVTGFEIIKLGKKLVIWPRVSIAIGMGLAISGCQNFPNFFTSDLSWEQVSNYNKAIKLDPNNGNVYYNLGNIHSAFQDKQNAIQYYQKAADLYQKQGKSSDYQDAMNKLQIISQH